jgi:hypothetical protein
MFSFAQVLPHFREFWSELSNKMLEPERLEPQFNEVMRPGQTHWSAYECKIYAQAMDVDSITEARQLLSSGKSANSSEDNETDTNETDTDITTTSTTTPRITPTTCQTQSYLSKIDDLGHMDYTNKLNAIECDLITLTEAFEEKNSSYIKLKREYDNIKFEYEKYKNNVSKENIEKETYKLSTNHKISALTSQIDNYEQIIQHKNKDDKMVDQIAILEELKELSSSYYIISQENQALKQQIFDLESKLVNKIQVNRQETVLENIELIKTKTD